ncbi:MAG: type 4b pilus protein PilO2 [Alphaproteobacteria bacterium]|nr:type 4b pilus protein PilO2 [Alphaproteobacteria bacterium]
MINFIDKIKEFINQKPSENKGGSSSSSNAEKDEKKTSKGESKDVSIAKPTAPVKKAKRSGASTKSYITVDRKKYAVGIFWQPFNDEENKLKEIKAVSKVLQDNKYDLYCVKEVGVAQYGLMSSQDGYKEGMSAAAPFVASRYSDKGSALCVFEVPEGWWMLVIRNDMILPEEDILYKSESEARLAFETMLSVPDWGYKVAPPSWNVSDADIGAELKTMIDDFSLAKIKSLSDQKTYSFIIFLFISMVVVFSMFKFKNQYMENKRQAAQELVVKQRQRLAKQKKIREEEEKRKIQKKIDEAKPWKNAYDPEEIYKVCFSTLKSVYLPFAGWGFSGISCSKDGARIDWRKRGLSKEEYVFRAQEEGYIPSDVSLTVSKNGSASGVLKFDKVKKLVSEPRENVKYIEKSLKDFFQENKISSIVKQGSKTFSFGEGKSIQEKTYKFVSFEITSKEKFSTFSPFLDSFGGMVVTSIEWSMNGKKWKYKGEIYGKD